MRNSARDLMKHERSSHTLQATALVNEACLKLMAEGIVDSADNRRQLFFAAIRSMRQILIDHARGRATIKRGADMQHHPIDIVLENLENQRQLSWRPNPDTSAGPRVFEASSLFVSIDTDTSAFDEMFVSRTSTETFVAESSSGRFSVVSAVPEPSSAICILALTGIVGL